MRKKAFVTVMTLTMALTYPALVFAAPICGDVNESGHVTSGDALAVLLKAVGQDVNLVCPSCGDGMIAGEEQCEPEELVGETCISQGFAGGQLACAAGCMFDTEGCYESRFDASGSTILDHETGLEWEKKNGVLQESLIGNCPGADFCDNPHNVGSLYQWSIGSELPDGGVFTDFLWRLNAGVTHAAGSATEGCYAGHCDWRMPTLEELETTVTACDSPPCVVDPVFIPSASTFYWSGTSLDTLVEYAWVMHLYSPDPMFLITNRIKTNFYRVRAVRGPN